MNQSHVTSRKIHEMLESPRPAGSPMIGIQESQHLFRVGNEPEKYEETANQLLESIPEDCAPMFAVYVLCTAAAKLAKAIGAEASYTPGESLAVIALPSFFTHTTTKDEAAKILDHAKYEVGEILSRVDPIFELMKALGMTADDFKAILAGDEGSAAAGTYDTTSEEAPAPAPLLTSKAVGQ